MSLTLHRINVLSPEDDFGEHVFLFALDNAQKLSKDLKSIESEEFNFGGNQWSLVCARKEDEHLGVFLKWRYPDPGSAGFVSVKTKFSISVIHQFNSASNLTFKSSSQKFLSSQPLLGKSKLAPMDELLDITCGYLDATGKQAMIELKMVECHTRFDILADVSQKSRTRKNASGIYFDTTTFVFANHRWFLRFYTKKVNSNGLPAIYLYLHGGSKGVSVNLQFTLFLGTDSTELVRYDFGEGAKFDGFGKTLADQFLNPDKLQELNVGVEIVQADVYKLIFIKLPSINPTVAYSPHQRSIANRSPLIFPRSGPAVRSTSRDKLTPQTGFNTHDQTQQFFQDHFGNPWKVDFLRNHPIRNDNSTALVFDKGVYNYQNNKTKIACLQAHIMSQNLEVVQDLPMSNSSILVCYFSNSLDDKGFPIIFPVSMSMLADEKTGFSSENNEIILRLDLISVQTSPFPVRSGPKFDFLINHLLRCKNETDYQNRNMTSMREMSASRASLSILDERPPSESSFSSGLGLQAVKSGSDSFSRTKSTESLLSSGHSDVSKAPPTNTFLHEFLHSLATSSPVVESDSGPTTARLNPTKRQGENGNYLSSLNLRSEINLVQIASCSHNDDVRQNEMTDALVTFIKQRFPLKVSEVVLQGSYGTRTSTSSRCDVDIIILSPDLPQENHHAWLPSLLVTLRKLMEQASIFESLISSLNCTSFATTSYSLQFTCDELLDVDIFVSHDWLKGANDLRAIVTSNNNSKHLINGTQLSINSWHLQVGSTPLKKKFYDELSNDIKDCIKVVKHWRNSINWSKFDHRPDSYLLSLLVTKAAELVREYNLSKILQTIGQQIMEPELKISWEKFYDLKVSEQFTFDPPSPVLQDPTNPAVNVAARLKYWGRFKTEYLKWMGQLKIKL